MTAEAPLIRWAGSFVWFLVSTTGSATRWSGPAFLASLACAPVPSETASSASLEPAAAQAAAAPPAHAAPTSAAKPEPPIPWTELGPVRHVWTTTGSAYVTVRERDPGVAQRIGADSFEFKRDHPRVPDEVRAIERQWVVTNDGVEVVQEPLGAVFTASPFGDNWKVPFAWKGGERRGVALTRAPHTTTKLVAPSEEPDPTGVLRKTIVAAVPKRLRPRPGVTIQMRSAPARLPGGATRVVCGWWDDEETPPSYGVVLSVDDDGRVVHRISKHRDYTTWASIEWIGDLDGDGIDEIGWGYGGIEDAAYFLTRFADGAKTDLELYASGH